MNHQVPDKTYSLFSEADSETAVIERMIDAPN